MIKPIEVYDDELAAETTAEEIQTFLERHFLSSRWLTFRLEVNCIHAFYILATRSFTNKSTFPSLRSLELTFTGYFSLDPDDTCLDENLHSSHLVFSEPQTQLRFLQIRGLFSPHIFGTSFHQHLTDLVHLELNFSGEYEWYDHKKNTPAARLIDMDPTSSEVVKALNVPKVHMPMLKTFLCLAISSPVWVLDHLLTLDAPNITTFGLTFGKEPLKRISGGSKAIRQLVSYIITSGPIGATRKTNPLFPSLANLTFSSPEGCFQENVEMLLVGYPEITSLALPKCSALQALVDLAPELVNLKVGVKDVTGLKDLLVKRLEAGIPLKRVQVIRSALGNPIESGALKELEDLVDFSLVDEEEFSKDDNH
ncbi:unnamed protein product [Rhizoctonia solani]|uniref:Uncharacterized protein n=1 Tax=Rhizoctonia solani TaxID=456999 RepID=A0A8H3AQ27_9AGAM|nr:unnamed protein product [Rhizoctonia solani]